MFEWLTEAISGSPWTYAIVLGVVCVDAFFPVVPGETAVITAAVLASGGELSVILVLLAAFLGALAGDQISYGLGRSLGRRAADRLFRDGRSRELLEWAKDQLRRRGGVIVVAGRFVPGGRTAVTFAAGTLGMGWPRFVRADLVGAGGWALFGTLLGYLGGEAFKSSLWKPLLLSFAVAGLVSLAAEGYRRYLNRRDDRKAAGAGSSAPAGG